MTPSRRTWRGSKGQRDANEGSILEVARALGYIGFEELSQRLKNGETINLADLGLRGFWVRGDENDGHDVTFYDSQGCFFVEVKNGELPPSGRKLRDTEELIMDLAHEFRLRWHLVESEQEMADVIADRWAHVKNPGCTCSGYQLENFGCQCDKGGDAYR